MLHAVRSSRLPRWLAGGAALAAVVLAACAKDAPASVLQTDDLVPFDGTPFDRNAIVESTVAFSDPYALPEGVLAFLKHTPYAGRPSFLATYQSNGVLAADAIQRAAEVYQINPLVFLVRAEMDQGLIGE